MKPLITKKKNICGGTACVAVTRIHASHLAGMFQAGGSIIDLAHDYMLSTAQVEAAIRYAARHPPKRRPCVWKLADDFDCVSWQGGCGASWGFDDGCGAENHMKFCPQCGRPVKVKKGKG